MKNTDFGTKEHMIIRIFMLLTVAICMIAAVICCFNKHGMHEDEFYSYYSSNRTFGLSLDGEISRDTVMDELTVLNGEGFNFGLVKEVQSWDVHPPLYYFLLHFVCSLTPGIFSVWQGLIINLICYAVCLILMKKLGDILIPDHPFAVICAVLCWGLSAAALTGAVFIRMYMLLSVWILAVSILHFTSKIRRPLKAEGNCAPDDTDRPVAGWFWPLLGVFTFLGFMTHYYFFIWLFFLAVIWNIREIVRTKSIKTVLLYGITMVVTFGLCYLFYPAFPAQMFKGQRGAQATGNFLDPHNTLDRISFFAEKINRIGFGSTLWILIGIMVIACFLVLDIRRGFRPKTAVWSVRDRKDEICYAPVRPDEADEKVIELFKQSQDMPENGQDNDSRSRQSEAGSALSRERSRFIGRFSDTKISVYSAVAYFLVVSKTALLLGDSSVRYQMPVLSVLYLCVFAGLAGVLHGLLVSRKIMNEDVPDVNTELQKKRGIITETVIICIIAVIVAGMNVVSDVNGNISFLYPEKEEHKAILSEYPAAEVFYVYPSGQSWIAWADMTELLMYDSVTYISEDQYEGIPAQTAVVYSDRGSAVRDDKEQLLFSTEYADVYVLKKN